MGVTKRDQRRSRRGWRSGFWWPTDGDGPKRCRVGKVTMVSLAEKSVTVHEYLAFTDGRMRLTWQPAYQGGGPRGRRSRGDSRFGDRGVRQDPSGGRIAQSSVQK